MIDILLNVVEALITFVQGFFRFLTDRRFKENEEQKSEAEKD
jgi:hypothetical protein